MVKRVNGEVNMCEVVGFVVYSWFDCLPIEGERSAASNRIDTSGSEC
jgi:hypothetical protein